MYVRRREKKAGRSAMACSDSQVEKVVDSTYMVGFETLNAHIADQNMMRNDPSMTREIRLTNLQPKRYELSRTLLPVASCVLQAQSLDQIRPGWHGDM